jgi:protein ImuB
VEKQRGALRLAALDVRAAMLGLRCGMSLADARAAVPDAHSLPFEPQADAEYLQQLAEDCGRYTPLLSLDAPDGLILDITGCAHLFGGENGLISDVCTHIDQLGLSLRCAMGSTAEAARVIARYATVSALTKPLTPAEEAQIIAKLPVAALELEAEAHQALIRAGLKKIGQVAQQPMANIAARFGMETASALRLLQGEAANPITAHRSLPPIMVEHRFAEPIASTPYALKRLEELLEQSAQLLDERGSGGRKFLAIFYRTDGLSRRLSVETGQPTRDAALVIRLFSERLEALRDPIDPGFGFDLIRLTVPHIEPLRAGQLQLEGGSAPDGALSELADRLATRLGKGRVRRYRPANTHIPEQAQLELPASEAPAPTPWPSASEGEPPSRPFYLFDPPEAVEVMAEVPDGPPHRFRWRRDMHHVLRYEGPERIAAEWWRRADNAGLTRDYYRVEDATGRRYWLFRHGLYDEKSAPRWYIHGLFA